MNHRVKVLVEVEKRGLFGRTKTVLEERTIVVDGKTYRQMKQEQREPDDMIDEMIFEDEILDDEIEDEMGW